MEVEEAWELFRSNQLAKSASITGQMDTMAAQIHEIQTGVDRLTTLIPKLMGDEAAIDAANAEASAPPDMTGMGDASGMGGEMMGAPEMGAPEDTGEDSMPKDEEKDTKETESADEVEKADDTEEKNVLGDGGDEPAGDDFSGADELGIGGDEPEGGEEVSEEISETPEGDIDVEEVSEDIPEPEMAPESEPMPEAPTGDMDFYAKMLAFLIQAASKAQEGGDTEAFGAIAKGAGELTKSFKDMAPALDSVMGTDFFSKACSDSSDVTGAEHPDDMMEKTDMPEGAEITDGMEKTDSKDPKMPSVEDEKGKTPTSECKLGPNDLGKSGIRMNSIRDMMEKGCAAIADGMEKADANMPEVPENGEDRSVGGTASEKAPEVPENGSDKSVGGSASVGDDGVIDPGSEKSSIQKGDGTGVTEQADDTASVLTKGQDMPGVKIQSIRDMMMYKSASRPDCIATANGDIATPEFGSPQMQKSAKGTSFRELMLAGASPEQFVEQDIARYNLFKAQGRY